MRTLTDKRKPESKRAAFCVSPISRWLWGLAVTVILCRKGQERNQARQFWDIIQTEYDNSPKVRSINGEEKIFAINRTNGRHKSDEIEPLETARTDGPPLDIRPQTSALTQCMLEMQQELVPMIYDLNQQCKPMMHSVKIINDVFHVLLNTIDLPRPARKTFAQAKYECNGISEGVKVSAHGTAAHRKGPIFLLVECPVSIRASQTVLSSISVRASIFEGAEKSCPYMMRDANTPTNATTGNNTVWHRYDAKIFDKCEREDIRYHEGRGLRPKTGIHAVFIGNRQKALQWAVYHHLTGFDHVWLYVNDDWNDGKGLVHRDYITWIPYQYSMKGTHEYKRERGFNPMEVFRGAGQHDGLWRAKRMGLDWFSAMDFDEYIRLDSPSLSSDPFRSSLESFGPGVTVSDIDTLPKYLDVFKERMGEKFLAITTNSIFFGRGPGDREQKRTNNISDCYSEPLDIDYVWREKGDVGKFPIQRVKNIVIVSCVSSVFIHDVQGGSCPGKFSWHPNANDLRHNHYKKPYNGVFTIKPQPPNNTEKDSSLVDVHREQILEELCSAQNEDSVR